MINQQSCTHFICSNSNLIHIFSEGPHHYNVELKDSKPHQAWRMWEWSGGISFSPLCARFNFWWAVLFLAYAASVVYPACAGGSLPGRAMLRKKEGWLGVVVYCLLLLSHSMHLQRYHYHYTTLVMFFKVRFLFIASKFCKRWRTPLKSIAVPSF